MYANLFKDKEQLYEAIKGLLKSVILKPRPVAVLGDIVAVYRWRLNDSNLLQW